VRRTRRLPLAELEPYLLQTSEVFKTSEVFGNDHPMEVEVGFGKGLFLVESGQARPDTNFLGIEIERKYQLFTANRLAKRGLKNVRLACADARAFFRDHLAHSSVQAIHVYFPDPWWKKRHHKRRVFTEEFVGQCARVLQPGGILNVITDVADYFALIQTLLAGQPALALLPEDDTNETNADLTNFERKYRQEGRPILRAKYIKGEPIEMRARN
jgi:tRNA (guanine-N7-)-methyltransferase